MPYPKLPDLGGLCSQIRLYSDLKHEYGSRGIEAAVAPAHRALQAALRALQRLPENRVLAAAEPNSLPAIQRLRPGGPRKLWKEFDAQAYEPRLAGAMLARAAGCTLGAIVEGWSIERMQQFAKSIGDKFPPTDYWSAAWQPLAQRYGRSRGRDYTRAAMRGVPVDDDLAYTQLGLLILEEYGPDFTTEDVGRAWVKYLPVACTAEEVALRNLKAGAPARKAADKDNPFVQWIGADIRSDPWGWLAPGWPQRAAEMAYRDAYLSHRRNGIYGEMFFAAAQAAAFAVDDPIRALEIGLSEIPRACTLTKDVKWALRVGPKIRDYRQARAAVDQRFAGMHSVHTNNNACLTIFGLFIGGKNLTKVIGQTVAMGLDNDCTAATAASIAGAVVGKAGLAAHWYRPFGDTMHSYLIGHKSFRISDLLRRFARQARRVWST